MRSSLALVAALLTVLFSGCSTHGLIKPLAVSPEDAATVTVIRDFAVMGSAVTAVISVDQKDVFGIRTGEYATIQIPAGDRLIGIDCLLMPDNFAGIAAERGRHYYFRVQLMSPCWTLVQLPEGAAKLLLDKTQKLELSPR
jgi:hypothetical protein